MRIIEWPSRVLAAVSPSALVFGPDLLGLGDTARVALAAVVTAVFVSFNEYACRRRRRVTRQAAEEAAQAELERRRQVAFAALEMAEIDITDPR